MIEVAGARKTFPGGVAAVDGVSFAAPAGEVCVLIGPSGCGKTTLLRCINRLLPLTAGTIRVAGRDVAGEDPVRLRRRIGYAIQQVGLFPNMTIGENIAVVPSLQGWPPERIRGRVGELLALVGLPEDYRARHPRELSGGEAQRVGVARALAADPPVLLMDEPFGALDPITRERLQGVFLDIQARLRKTVVLVSHDMDEALRLGDRIVLMRAGRVEQVGPPEAFLLDPATAYVRDFLGGEAAFGRRAALPVRLAAGSAADVEAPAGPGLAAETPVREALLALAERGAGRARVLAADGRPVGVVTLRDLVRLLAGHRPGREAPP